MVKNQSSLAVLAPDGAAVVFALMRSFEGIVDGGNNQDEPRNRSEDLVSGNDILRVGRGLAKRICYCVWLAHASSKQGCVECTNLLASLLLVATVVVDCLLLLLIEGVFFQTA